MSSDPEQEYFNDGMTDTLITDLSQLSGLFVIARNSVFTYKGKPVKVQEVSKELGVRYVLEGSVQKANNRVRINVQLIDATTGGHVWAERFDRDLKDIFALQDEVTQQDGGGLAGPADSRRRAHLIRKTTDNVEAYDALLRGQDYYSGTPKRPTPRPGRCLSMLLSWTLAMPMHTHAGLTYWLEYVLNWSQIRADAGAICELAHQALALDDSLPRPCRLGYAYLFKTDNLTKALPNYSRRYASLPTMPSVFCFSRRAQSRRTLRRSLRTHPHGDASQSPLSSELSLQFGVGVSEDWAVCRGDRHAKRRHQPEP